MPVGASLFLPAPPALLGISITSQTPGKPLQEIVFFLAKVITFLWLSWIDLTVLDFAVWEQDSTNVNKQNEFSVASRKKPGRVGQNLENHLRIIESSSQISKLLLQKMLKRDQQALTLYRCCWFKEFSPSLCLKSAFRLDADNPFLLRHNANSSTALEGASVFPGLTSICSIETFAPTQLTCLYQCGQELSLIESSKNLFRLDSLTPILQAKQYRGPEKLSKLPKVIQLLSYS